MKKLELILHFRDTETLKIFELKVKMSSTYCPKSCDKINPVQILRVGLKIKKNFISLFRLKQGFLRIF